MSKTVGHKDLDEENPIADAIRYAANVLGTGNASTSMGALEVVANEIKEGSERMAGALSEVAAALNEIAAALRERE
jgi:methyl-accepting chemotaxis protein